MQMNRKELLEVLNFVKLSLVNSQIGYFKSDCFVFEKGRVATFNANTFTVAEFDAGFDGAVHATELLSLLGKLKAETIDISLGKGELVIKAGRSKAGIRYTDVANASPYAEFAPLADMECYEISEQFVQLLKNARFCAGADAFHEVLFNVYVGKGTIQSCNSHRAIRYTLEGKDKGLPEFMIPQVPIKQIPDGMDTIYISKNWVVFKDSVHGREYWIRRNSTDPGSFPDLTLPFGVSKDRRLTLPVELRGAIEKAEQFMQGKENESRHYVTVTLKPKRLHVRGEGEYGWYEESVSLPNYAGDSFTFMSDTECLKALLPLVQDVFLDRNRAMFKGADFEYVFTYMKEVGPEYKEDEDVNNETADEGEPF